MNIKSASLLITAAFILVALAGFWYINSTQRSVNAANPENLKQVRLGEAIYGEHCAACHGANLEGQTNWQRTLPTGGLPAPPHDQTGHTWHHPDSLLFDYTKRGGAALLPPGVKSNMPGFGSKLSDAEIWAVLAFIKSRWPENIRHRHATLNSRNR